MGGIVGGLVSGLKSDTTVLQFLVLFMIVAVLTYAILLSETTVNSFSYKTIAFGIGLTFSLVPVTYLFTVPIYFLVKRFGNQFYWGSKTRIIVSIGLGCVITIGTFLGMRSELPNDPYTYILTALTWSVLGGFVEEPLYRGALMTALTNRFGPKFSIPLQAIAFGLSHPWSLGDVLVGIILGLFLGIIAKYLGLWSSVVIHFLINVLTSNTMP